MSDTPRLDAIKHSPRPNIGDVVRLCETLERENAKLREALAQYLAAKPQCECTDPSCAMQAARIKARLRMAVARDIAESPK